MDLNLIAPPTTFDLLAVLARAFPRQKAQLTEDTLRLYAQQLSDLPLSALELAVQDLIRTEDWYPTVRALRAATAERLLALPSETEALAQIDARAAWAAGERKKDEAPPLHPLVREAVDAAGGWFALRSAEQASRTRSTFLRLYSELRARRVRVVQVDGYEAAAA